MEGSNNKPGRAITWIALAVFSAILMLVLVFSEPAYSAFCAFSEKSGSRCLRDFVSEFQTLITGLAAVMAASATIYVMQRTDSRQEARHREQVLLVLRPDKLKIERAMYPQLAELRAIQAELAAFDDSAENYQHLPGDAIWHLTTAATGEYFDAAVQAISVLERPQFLDAKPLFGGDLTYKLDLFQRNASSVCRALSRHNQNMDPAEPDALKYEVHDFDEISPWLKDMLPSLSPILEAIIQDLELLEGRYETEHG